MAREAGLPGGLCVVGQLRRILGCPRDPPDCLEGCVGFKGGKGGGRVELVVVG